MLINTEYRGLANFIMDRFGHKLVSKTKKIESMIEARRIKSEDLNVYTEFLIKHDIPYKIRKPGEHLIYGDLSNLKEEHSNYLKTFYDNEELDRVIVRNGEYGICFLKQYSKDDINTKNFFRTIFHDFIFENSEYGVGVEGDAQSISSSVGNHNYSIFEEATLGDKFCYFMADKRLKDRFKRVSSRVLGFEIDLKDFEMTNEEYNIEGLVWFNFKDEGYMSGTHMSYKLLCALVDANVRHIIFTDRDGKVTVDCRGPRPRSQGDNRISRSMYRDDLGANLKSSWEANFARVLNYLGINWEYEKEHYLIEGKNEDDNIIYTPDFFLNNNIIVETKGFWDNESRKKVNAFKESNKDHKFYLIDGDMFITLEKLYKRYIEHWEDELVSAVREVLPVVGINFFQRKKLVDNLINGERVFLKRDPENPYDKNAIQVINKQGRQVGFISKDWAPIYAQKIDIGMTFETVVRSKEKKVLWITIERDNKDVDLLYDFLINKDSNTSS